MLGISFCVQLCERGNPGISYAALSRVLPKVLAARFGSLADADQNKPDVGGVLDGGPEALVFADHRTSLHLTTLLRVSASNFIQHTKSGPDPTQLGKICRLDHDYPALLSSSLRLLNANVFSSFTRLRTWICRAQHQAHDPW
jgi:hypothetical protein